MPMSGICAFCGDFKPVSEFGGFFLCEPCGDKAKLIVGREIAKLAGQYLAKQRASTKEMSDQRKTSGGEG
jgi:hypothetical protein